jgi:hypothetical protein
MTTFRIVKTYTGKYALLSKGGTSVTGKRFRCPADAKAWAAKAGYSGITFTVERSTA